MVRTCCQLTRCVACVQVSAKSKAPQDDAEYNDAVKYLKTTITDVNDLESKASGVNAAVTKLSSEVERASAAADKLSVSTTLGRSTDLSPVKSAVEAHTARWTKLQADLKALKAELAALDKHVDERHKAGAEMQKLKTKVRAVWLHVRVRVRADGAAGGGSGGQERPQGWSGALGG